MTEHMTMSVKEEALDALRRAEESLTAEGHYTTQDLYDRASKMSNLAPHFIKWADEQ